MTRLLTAKEKEAREAQRKAAQIALEQREKQEAYNREFICKLFGVKIADQVSKPALINTLTNFYMQYQYLSGELYCENPNHSFFKKSLPEDIDRLKKYKERKEQKNDTEHSAPILGDSEQAE